MEKGIFQPPSLEGYTFEKSWTIDVDQIQDGIKETTIEKYVKSKNQVILKWTTKGKTWYWSILNNYSDKNDHINNYGIKDEDGKGVFTEKYYGVEQFYLPDYLR
ncbi:MAG: hypothetical protein FJ139_06565 [Deltaproteobacteria bacterium]|nr:hypothetical protein [Deltaproteobacteria bacterium]